MIINFTIYGEPVSQGRPKFFRRGNFVGAYDPKKSKKAKFDIKLQSLEYKPEKPLQGAIHLNLEFYKSKPKTLSKKVQYNIKRPDLDNYNKLVCDALSGIFWNDDSQIVSCYSKKYYCCNGDMPRIEICIEEL